MQWLTAKLNAQETYTQMAQRVSLIVQAWLEHVHDFADLLVQEHLMAVFPTDLKTWVARSNPPTATEMARIADTYNSTTPREPMERPRKWTPY